MLTVASSVPLDIEFEGRILGSSLDGEVTLPIGQHRLRLINRALGYQTQISVDIEPSTVTTHTAALPEGQVQVNAPAGSEIWIEGTLVGVAPLGVMPLPIGTRAVVVRHPELGEQQGFVEVRYGQVTAVNLDPRDEIRRREADFPLPSLSAPGPTIR
jgi:hypothetical protein